MTDPKQIIAESRMGGFQILAVVLCVLLNAVDGFDVLSISFASPGVAADWGITRATLGIVLSMELIGMAAGSIVIGRFADLFGRRPVIIASLLTMIGGMLLAATSSNVTMLSSCRFLTGIGIGGMLAAVNAMVAEYSSDRHRNLAVTIMAAGFPLGAIFGGLFSTILLAHFGWHSVFLLGAGMTLVMLPLVWWFLPESISYLVNARPPGALEKINRTLTRMGHTTIDRLPPVPETRPKKAGLFARQWRTMLMIMTVAYFAHIMTFYFILKWIPKIVVDMGFAPSTAGGVLVWANVGGAAVAILLGLLSQKIDVRTLVITVLVASVAMICIFGMGFDGLTRLAIVAGIAGFFTNSAVVGLYALMASNLPTQIRAGGTGFVIGVGRGGAALGPIIAGYLFTAGAGLQVVAIVMAMGSALAAFVLLFLRKPKLID